MTLYYNNKKVSALHKVYLGDKLVFGGGGSPTPASTCLVYNEASPSKLTLKAGTYKATVFNRETGEETVQDYVLATDTDIDEYSYNKPYTSFDMTNKTDRAYQFKKADGSSSYIDNKKTITKGLENLDNYPVPVGKMNIASSGDLILQYYNEVTYANTRYNSMTDIDAFAPQISLLSSGTTYTWNFKQRAEYQIPAGRLFEFDVSLNEFFYKEPTVPTCTITLKDADTNEVLYTRDQTVNYRSSTDSLYYYGYWSYTNLPPLNNVAGKNVILDIEYDNLKFKYNSSLTYNVAPAYSISGKLYDPSTPDPVTVEIMDFGGRQPNISVRTYHESMAERYPNGLCGTISFDSEMNVSSVT